MKIALIPCGATEWADEGRLLGRVELPLTTAGEQCCLGWAQQLRSMGLQRVVHAPDELSSRTAELLAEQLAIPAKALEELSEVDVGLWAGLTEAQLRTRYPSAHHELRESPLNVKPPAGEGLQQAAERVRNAVMKQVKRNGAPALAFVLRPLAFELLRGALTDGECDVLEAVRKAPQPVIMDVNDHGA